MFKCIYDSRASQSAAMTSTDQLTKPKVSHDLRNRPRSMPKTLRQETRLLTESSLPEVNMISQELSSNKEPRNYLKMKIIALVLCSTMLTLCADAASYGTNKHRLRERVRRLERENRSLRARLSTQRSNQRKAETELNSLKDKYATAEERNTWNNCRNSRLRTKNDDLIV